MLLPIELPPAPSPLQPYPNLPDQQSYLNGYRVAVNIISTVYGAGSGVVTTIASLPGRVKRLFITERDPLLTLESLQYDQVKIGLFKTNTECFDNKFWYILSSNQIYIRPFGADPQCEWKPVSTPNQRPLLRITADGDDLFVTDDQDKVWYGKTTALNAFVSFQCPRWELQGDMQWTTQIFNTPVLSTIINRFKDPTAYLPLNTKKICASHSGPETFYYTDPAGKIIPAPFVGTTELSALTREGRIFILDPGLQNRFENEIITPENGQFVAENMDVSAGTYMLIRRTGRVNSCYTRYIQTDELLTLHPHTYNKNNSIPYMRTFPPESWKKQPPIPLLEDDALTDQISVLQVGQGQDKRLLWWESKNGFYSKMVYDTAWQFNPTKHTVDPRELIPKVIPTADPIARDYFSEADNELVKTIYLRNYIRRNATERAPETRIDFQLVNHQFYSVRLHQLKGLFYYLGLTNENDKWRLIAPHNLPDSPEAQRVHNLIMGGDTDCAVDVSQGDNTVRVWKDGRFNLQFRLFEAPQGLMSSQFEGGWKEG